MSSAAQKEASSRHRERQRRRGFVRLEVHVPREDADALRIVARLLRSDAGAARQRARQALRRACAEGEPATDPKAALSSMPADLPLERTAELPRELDL